MHLLNKVKLILLSPYHLVAKSVYVYAFHHILLALHSLCIPYIYIYAHTYRITRRSDFIGIQGRGRGGPAGVLAPRSSRRRIGAGRIT
jgi:hypothetical protein